MKSYILLPLLFFSLFTFSQDYNFGMQVTRDELKTNVYEKDSTANALVIYDYGDASFNKENFWLNIDYKKKVKILTKDGVNRGEIEIPIYRNKSSKESIKDIRAMTYNIENGEVIISKLSPEAIFKDESTENWTIIKFVLPKVKIGSVITYSYTKSTKFINNFEPWYFQGKDPVLYSEYNTSIPGNYEYNIKLVSYIPLFSQDDTIDYNCVDGGRGAYANCAVTKYVMKDIPAYKDEKFTTTPNNYLSHIEYELSVVKRFNGEVEKLTKSWSDVDDEMKTDSNFGRLLRKKNSVKELLPKDINDINNQLKKAKVIYQYVLDNYSWNNKLGRYDASVKRLIEDKGGNAFELNIFLENLLTSQGFEVYPILISTRNNGLATKIYPVNSDFNYVILKTTIDDKDYFLDATNPYLAFGELPFRCLNQYGRLFDFKHVSYWEDINPSGYSTYQIASKLELNDDNLLSGVVKNRSAGYISYNFKRAYYEDPSQYIERLRSQYPFSTIKTHKVNSKSKNDVVFNEELNVVLEDEFVGDKIYFNPFLTKFYSENPFKLQERTYPIDFGYKQSFSYILEIDLKDKLKVVELPKNIRLALPNKTGSVIFSSTVNENKLNTFIRIKFDKAIYGAEYYEALKNFMSKIVEIQNNTIVVLEKQ